MLVSKSNLLFGCKKMRKTEVFFRVLWRPFGETDGEWLQSKTEYKTHKEAKEDAKAAVYAPNEYKIVRCERKVI